MATATRILVQCRTRQMPGSPNEKIGLMADAACQKVWNRNFDHAVDGDRLMSFGGHVNPMCILLVDHGDVEAPEQTTIQLSWNGRELINISGPIHPYIQKELRTQYHFNPALRQIPKSYTDEELKEVLSPEHYDKFIRDRAELLARADQ